MHDCRILKISLMKHILLFALISSLLLSCKPKEVSRTMHHPAYHYAKIDQSTLAPTERVYIPIYSDIYFLDAEHTFSLTATLSIRNTSFKDSVYVFSVDYYNSVGQKQRRYNDSVILLKPMESIEFVVDNKDNKGGVGANFVAEWGARPGAQKPYFQGVMIGTTGQQGISFTTEGIVIKQ